MVACSNTHAEVVKLLLAHKATDVKALDEDHDTALRYANEQNSTEIIGLLWSQLMRTQTSMARMTAKMELFASFLL